MKETGVVRRLDNLGRLVIPKEIRRCMRIKEGSPIEFGLLPSGEIYLKKYSLVGQINDYAEDFSEVLSDVCECGAIVADRDSVISIHGISKKNTLGLKLSSCVLDIIDSNNCYIASKKSGTTIIPIVEDDKNTYYSQIILPVNIQGECEGIVALVSTDEKIEFDVSHQLVLRVIAKFLGKQLDR